MSDFEALSWALLGVCVLASFAGCSAVHYRSLWRTTSGQVGRDRYVRRMQAAEVVQLTAEVKALQALVEHLKGKAN